MSQENVEIVKAVYDLGPDADLAQLTREDDLWTAWVRRVDHHFQPGWRASLRTGVSGKTDEFSGFDGLRAACLDWLAPMATYRREIERIVDPGDRVLLLCREYARLRGSEDEIGFLATHLLTFQDGKVIRWDTFPDRAEALKAVGLEE